MNSSVRIIVFSAVLGIICSVLLAGATLYTAPFREANAKAEEVRNFLGVMGAPVQDAKDSRKLLEMFDKVVRVKHLGDLTLYEYIPADSADQKPVSVAIPFSGMGLWGQIKGVIALTPDLRTIQGVSFYDQAETPGLGGEIGSERFQKEFVGKQLASASGEPVFRVLKPGGSPGVNEVDGISGATMTSDRVQLMLSNLAKAVEKERSAYVQ